MISSKGANQNIDRLSSVAVRLMWYVVILRAISEKLIPGLPYTTKVSILQQTSTEHQDLLAADNVIGADQVSDLAGSKPGKTVLQEVIESDVSRNETLREIAGKLAGKSNKCERP